MAKTRDGVLSKWISPETERKLMRAARAKARVTFWDADIFLLRFGGSAAAFVGLILLTQQAGVWPIVIALLVSLVGVVIIARMRGLNAIHIIYNQEFLKRPDEWKDYYEILRIGTKATFKEITEAHDRLVRLFNEVLSEKTKELGLFSPGDINEAFDVLSDRGRRAAYDRLFWLRTNMRGVPIGDSGRHEIVTAMQSVGDGMDKFVFKGQPNRYIPGWGRPAGQAVIAACLGIMPVVAGGTSLAFAKPDNSLSVPFRGIAVSLARVSCGALDILVDIRSIAANQERSVIATAFQAMRLDDNLKFVTPLNQPTSDMAAFPAREHPLYPEYIETRFSQFRYTVDEYGVVNVDPSLAETDAVLEKLKQLISELLSSE